MLTNQEMTNINIHYQSINILVLDNVLLEEECNKLKSLQTEFGKMAIKDSNISNEIEKRCEKFITDLIYEYDKDTCKIRTLDVHYWKKDKINTGWNLYKCKLGRSMPIHMDRITVKSVDNKSMFTIIIYLETSDGNLKFKEIEVKPVMGRVVIFKQDLLHEGLENKDKIKYYLHSSILYERLCKVETTNDKIALDMFYKSKELVNDESEQMLNEAFKLSQLLERTVLCLI